MATNSETPLLLSPSQVQNLIKMSPNVALLDTTWFMPNSTRNAKAEHAGRRIPDSQFLDLDDVASPHELGLKHMMPTPKIFTDACERLGVKADSHVVIYDAHGVFSSPRALFMFRAFGHNKSSIIDGGLPRWATELLPIESGLPKQRNKTTYPTPMLATEVIQGYQQMTDNAVLGRSDTRARFVVDARSYGRFTGQDPEPRPGLSSGHIPHSFSLPFDTFLQHHATPSGIKYTTFLPRDQLRLTLEKAVGLERAERIIAGDAPVTTTCGSGMTAGVLWLGLKLLGVRDIALYDESWAGYASRKQSVIACG